MDWMSFTMGLLGGFIGTIVLLVILLMVYARPFFQVAKKQRETQDQVIKNWADQLAAAGKAQAEAQKNPKWGSGNSG
jgi:hypothetical protein